MAEKFRAIAGKREAGAHGYGDHNSDWKATPEALRKAVDAYNGANQHTKDLYIERIQREPQMARWTPITGPTSTPRISTSSGSSVNPRWRGGWGSLYQRAGADPATGSGNEPVRALCGVTCNDEGILYVTTSCARLAANVYTGSRSKRFIRKINTLSLNLVICLTSVTS